MRPFAKELWFETRKRYELEALRESEFREGLLLRNAMRIASSVLADDDS
jgi:hypothetical protein